MILRTAISACRSLLAVVVSGWVLLQPAALFAQMSAYGLAARVNGVGISNETLERSFQEYIREQNMNIAAIRNPDRVKRMRLETLDLLIDQELAWQAARKAKALATDAEVDEALRAVRSEFHSEQAFASRLAVEGYTEERYREHLRRLVSARNYLDRVAAEGPKVNDEEIHSFYAANPDKFIQPERIHARHILVKEAPGSGEDGKHTAQRKAAGILKELRAGEDFAEMARKYSEDSTAAQGGDLGWFARGKMVKPFEDAAFALKAGAVSAPVETPFGVHIIQVMERAPQEIVSEKEAKERIRSFLQGAKGRDAVREELQRLRAAAKIEILLPL